MIRFRYISPATGETVTQDIPSDMAQAWWDAASHPVRESVSIEEVDDIKDVLYEIVARLPQ